jgi:5-dehydro-2-deoxygluconokinase
MSARPLDVVCLGRAAVDLYGVQVGGRFEDVATFAKYVGGSSANLAIGLARLGLRSSMLTRVGDEQMGRYVRETLAASGVDVSHVATDPHRLTGLVLLGIEGPDRFPHIFYRENCADMALERADFDAAYIASTRCLALTGTHLSTPQTAEAVMHAVSLAKAAGSRIVLDVDFRPVLWGLASHGEGANRFAACPAATQRLQALLPHCDLVVGTEDEIRIAGGVDDLERAVAAISALTCAALVIKRGPAGCSIVPPAESAAVSGAGGSARAESIDVAGFPVEVLNTLGAGDAFLSGFLCGFLSGADWRRCGELGNACGALVVSRHGCSPALPTLVELDEYLARGEPPRRPDLDDRIETLHVGTTLRRPRDELYVLAFDHRRQLEQLAGSHGAPLERVVRFKSLIGAAVEAVAARSDVPRRIGVIIDDRYGTDVLQRMTLAGRWVGRPVEIPGSRPLEFDPRRHIGLPLATWPATQVVKCLVSYHPDDDFELRAAQEAAVVELYRDTQALDRELLLEIIAARRDLALDDETVARAMRRFYNLGVRPAWWKLEPQRPEAWRRICATIDEFDPHCNGVLLLGLDAEESELERAFEQAAPFARCRGFAVGRSIFGQPARDWIGGRLADDAVVADIATRYDRLIAKWREIRA